MHTTKETAMHTPRPNESKTGKSDPEQGSELVPQLPKDEHEEELIDEALTETFPASDPISIPVPEDQRSK